MYTSSDDDFVLCLPQEGCTEHASSTTNHSSWSYSPEENSWSPINPIVAYIMLTCDSYCATAACGGCVNVPPWICLMLSRRHCAIVPYAASSHFEILFLFVFIYFCVAIMDQITHQQLFKFINYSLPWSSQHIHLPCVVVLWNKTAMAMVR